MPVTYARHYTLGRNMRELALLSTAVRIHHEQRAYVPEGARLDDVEDVLDGERLEVETAGGVVIRRHRLRIAVQHDRLEAGVPVTASHSACHAIYAIGRSYQVLMVLEDLYSLAEAILANNMQGSHAWMVYQHIPLTSQVVTGATSVT